MWTAPEARRYTILTWQELRLLISTSHMGIWSVISTVVGLACILPGAAAVEAEGIFQETPTEQSGITWTHQNGKSKQRYLPEMTGSGVAIFDYNKDGWMDILLVNSGPSRFYHPSSTFHQALYRNNRDGTYTDVAHAAGLNTELFGMGVAIGDYDNDGLEDIFITGVDRCVLYHNQGNGTFADATMGSGISPTQWSTSALWFDFDNDGKLDLFVAEFADYTDNKICSLAGSYGGSTPRLPTAQSYYCHPKLLKSASSHLYRNLGSGKFADVSQAMGVAQPGKAWGAVATDVNNDGYMDLFVSNDTIPNFLWLNENGQKFQDIGLESGVAYSNDGVSRSGMGVDAADFDRDGRSDLIVGNIDAETTSLYRNRGSNLFDDMNRKTGIGPATRMLSTWGLQFFDYDNDGWLDIVLCNGYPDDTADERDNGITYRQPILLFHNSVGTKMENVSRLAGPAFGKRYTARGLAVGDLNNDGYPDVVFTENGGPPHVLMNTGGENQWVGLKLEARKANPAAVGAVIRWHIGNETFSRLKTDGGSFLSSRDSRVILGAGKGEIDWIEVQWPRPSEQVDRIDRPRMNHYVTVKEGQNPQ
jgi:enediyne biosynthesis protein E4